MREPQIILMLTIMLPFITAAVINLFGTKPRLRAIAQIVLAAATAACAVRLAMLFMHGGVTKAYLFELYNRSMFGFATEPLGIIYAILLGVLWLASIFYTLGYFRLVKTQNQTRFYIYFALTIGCGMGIAFSANLLVMYIFYEAMTLVTYPLVTHLGGKKDLEAGKTYLGYLLGSSAIILLPAIGFCYYVTGTLDFTEGGNFYSLELPEWAKLSVLILFMYGFAKSALMPLHKWLTAAMVAPAPVSGLLHAVAVVKAGVFCFGKVFIYIFGADNLAISPNMEQVPIIICALTMLGAGVLAIIEPGIKRRLAYSTISSLAGIMAGFLFFSSEGVIAAAAGMLLHGAAKIVLFFAVGAVIAASGISSVNQVAGMGRKYPVLFGCFLLCSLSLIGLPPLAGYEGKLLMQTAALDAEIEWFGYFLYIMMAVSAAYLLPLSYMAFAKKPVGAPGKAKMPFLVVAPVAGLTVLLIAYPLWGAYLNRLMEKIIV